jgi:hypothetical protein
MGFFRLSTGDPITELLTNLLNANIVRVPEARIKPLAVVAAHGDKTAWRGSLSELLVGNPALAVAAATSPMAALSGKQSKDIDFDFGLDILKSFLAGFGIPPVGLEAGFKGATKTSFSFNDVAREFIDKDELGSALTGKQLVVGNPAAAIFLGDDPWDLLLIDSIIASSDFTMSVEDANSSTFKVDIGVIQEIVGKANAGVSVSLAASRVVSFKGPVRLTFAFTCVKLYSDEQGKLTVVDEDLRRRELAAHTGAGGARRVVRASPERVRLTNKEAMVDWDAWPSQ